MRTTSASLGAPRTLGRRGVLALAGGALVLSTARMGFAAGAPVRVETFTAGEDGMRVNAHLIAVGDEVLLLDAQMLREDALALADRIAATGLRFERALISHAHPDHFLGAPFLAERFPGVRFQAPAPVAARIAEIGETARGFVAAEFGDRVAARVEPVAAMDGLAPAAAGLAPEVVLGGEDLVTLTLFDPDTRTLIAADTLYEGTHLYLGNQDIDGWLAILRDIEALAPRTVHPGHGASGPLAPIAEGMRRYMAEFQATVAASASAQEAEARMLDLHPDHGGRRLLGLSLAAHFPEQGAGAGE